MAAQSSPPLDEVQYRRPDIIQWWVNDFGGQPMDENMIHRYLAESPFFDHSTKNGLHFGQARTNQAEFDLVKDRRRFEDDLARHIGSEYMIVGEPRELQSGSGRGQSSGVWNVRKQQRDRQRDPATGRWHEELSTLGTYYIVGENMYQAPSVGDVVGNRLLSAAASLSKFYDTAAELPSFSSTTGYTYLPQTSGTSAGPSGSTRAASPTRSREGSVVPGVDLETQSVRSTSAAPGEGLSNGNLALSAQGDRLLAQSFRMALEFNDEYMDDNPLLGEPGRFSFTASLAAVKKRKAADEEAAALEAKARAQKAAGSEATGKADKVSSPPAVMTEAKAVQARDKERRSSKMGDRIRRKKSRANVGSLVGVAEGAAAG